MRILATSVLLFLSIGCRSADTALSTIELIGVTGGHVNEARFYYENNWLAFRKAALSGGYIGGYRFEEVLGENPENVRFILTTIYKDEAQYEVREESFAKVMQGRELQLLNELTPTDFRRTVLVLQRTTGIAEAAAP